MGLIVVTTLAPLWKSYVMKVTLWLALELDCCLLGYLRPTAAQDAVRITTI
jgi:hypothetical protein